MKTPNKSGERGTKNISVTISKELDAKINTYLENPENKHATRSNLIEDATEDYLSYIECPCCHRQTASKNYCSYCGNQLDITETDRKVAEYIYLYEQHPEHAPDKNSKNIITVSLSDNQIRRLLNGDVIEQADVNIIPKKQYSKNVYEYIARRRKNTKTSN